MKFASALALFATAALPSVFAENITVAVGQGGNTFTPSTVAAKVGDIILFKFVAGNHSVTQAPFANPCTQAWLDDDRVPGFTTKFVQSNASSTPVVPIRIDSTQPLWLFCQQARHCNNGMVMVINPPADGSKTLEQFKANAATAAISSPGTFANFSASNSSTGNSTNKKNDAHSPRVLSGGLAAVALLISGLIL